MVVQCSNYQFRSQWEFLSPFFWVIFGYSKARRKKKRNTCIPIHSWVCLGWFVRFVFRVCFESFLSF
ncbi:hypothetical protein CPC08DRAFT_433819 [Agrocybe pediades]|nr:hypothetical protein CPC08DRAFT_433819 [Agrocybe pediades]